MVLKRHIPFKTEEKVQISLNNWYTSYCDVDIIHLFLSKQLLHRIILTPKNRSEIKRHHYPRPPCGQTLLLRHHYPRTPCALTSTKSRFFLASDCMHCNYLFVGTTIMPPRALQKHQRSNNKPKINKDGYNWGRLRRITNDKLHKFAQHFQDALFVT